MGGVASDVSTLSTDCAYESLFVAAHLPHLVGPGRAQVGPQHRRRPEDVDPMIFGQELAPDYLQDWPQLLQV